MKVVEKENFAEMMQMMIKVKHSKSGRDLRFMQMLLNVIGVNDPYYTTDEQLINEFKKFYAQEIRN